MTIGAEDHARIRAAIQAAEARTSGEIVCVLARASSEYAAAPLLYAALVALLAPWPLILFTELSVRTLFALQIVIYMVALVLLSAQPVRVALTPKMTRRRFAHRAATEQFMARRLSNTKDRTGVLIFVSMAEHYARIVVDEGLAAKVEAAEWQKAVDTLTARIGSGNITEGFVAAIDQCGTILARHAPPSNEPRNELPDRLYVI